MPDQATRTDGARTAKPAKSETVKTQFGTCRVLVADDEHLVATGLAAVVRDLGHTVVGVASDGVQAVELAAKHTPDVCLLDIRMPNLDGISAALQIYEKLGIPSLIISAYSDEDHLAQIQRNGIDSGVFGYLLKPVAQEELRVQLGVLVHRAEVDRFRSARVSQLETNLQNRRTVEQAKWKMVETAHITEAEAHEKLQRMARNKRTALVDIAKAVIAGELTPE
jgi:response regulator NasT